MAKTKLPSIRSRLKFIIFSLIGVFNTLFDIALYVVILSLSHAILVANLLATSAALIGSYLLNSRLTFKSTKWTRRSFSGFVVVTVFGLWVLQTTAIVLFNRLLHVVPEHVWQLAGPVEHLAKTVTPKLLATGITFVWNYQWYNKVIFKSAKPQQNALQALGEL